MRIPRSVPALSASLLLAGTTVNATQPDTGAAAGLISQGDVYYAQLDAAESLKYYLPAEKLEPHNAELLVKISREYRHLMSDAANAKEKARLGAIAIDYARRAVQADSSDPDAHLAVAISYGKMQPVETNADRIMTSRIVKAEADKTLELNPGSDLAWHVLGRWNMGYAQITGVKRALADVMYGKLPVTTYEDAAQCFRKAIELKPDRLMHYIELGCCYAEMGKAADAREMITKGLAMKETEKDDPETKRRGEEELSKLR